MKKLSILFTSLFLSPFLAAPTFAELYQWKDENGRVHFSDKKPGSNSSVNTLQPPEAQRPSGRNSTSTDSSTHSASPEERQKRLLHVMKQEADQKEKAQRTAERNRQKQEAECQKLREHQNSSAGRRLFYTDKKDENGDLIYLDEKQRAEYDQQIATTISEKCE